MLGIIGKKLGMTSIFGDDGKNVACTIVEAGPCYVSQLKDSETDGYNAAQLAFGEKNPAKVNKALTTHYKKAGLEPSAKMIEFRDFGLDKSLGDEVTVDEVFAEGDVVNVIGRSKGKGFQGVVKRYNFKGVGDATHGQHNRQRAPGAIGMASTPSRVFKGMRMGGRTGQDRIKVKNLSVLRIDQEQNLLLIKGAIPGSKGSYIIIESAV